MMNAYILLGKGEGEEVSWNALNQCFSVAGPWSGTGPWHQLYRAARDSPGTDN